jgi:hypothetical protein
MHDALVKPLSTIKPQSLLVKPLMMMKLKFKSALVKPLTSMKLQFKSLLVKPLLMDFIHPKNLQ